jgi:hypothetical protein
VEDAPREVCWLFKNAGGEADIRPCHAVLVELARAFDSPAEVEAVVAALAPKYADDPHLGPDSATAVREVVAELFAEGSLRPA